MSVLLFLPFLLLLHHQLIILPSFIIPRKSLEHGRKMRNVQSVSGQSAGLGLKGLPVLREVSSSLWVTAEEKE